MDGEYKSGQTDRGMMGFGEIVWLMVMEGSFMLKVTFMKVNGLTIKLMVSGYTHIIKAGSMKASGSRTSNTGTELKHGQTETNLKGTTCKV